MGKNSLVIYSMMFPRAADDKSPGPPGGQTALLPLAEGGTNSSDSRTSAWSPSGPCA
jgi:hypothetical protein